MAELNVKMTPNRIVIMRELEKGAKKWGDLRSAYFGPERSKHPASTSFYQQVVKLTSLGLIVKVNEQYSLTPIGVKAIAAARAAGLEVDGAKTDAEMKFDPSKYPNLQEKKAKEDRESIRIQTDEAEVGTAPQEA